MSRVVVALLLAVLAAPLSASAETGEEICRSMIEAHGGMDAWASAPSVTFTEEWRPGAAESGMSNRIRVEQGPRRAVHEYLGTPMRMGWDGETAWSMNWASPAPPRFMALLNYYFVNLPWLTMDPGVNLGEPGTGTLPGDDTEYLTVMMTFDAGVGDTPDDWYRLYIHPETRMLAANDYIVTYDPLVPEGMEHTPVHLLVYDEWTEVDGLTVPTHFTIYEEDKVYATCAIRDWSFREPFDPAAVEKPEGAVVDRSLSPAGSRAGDADSSGN